MTTDELFKEALERLQESGCIRFPNMYIEYYDPEKKQDCVDINVFDMPERLWDQLFFLLQAGRRFAHERPHAILQTVSYFAEAWYSHQDAPTKEKPFVEPVNDPKKIEVVVVEQANFLTPQEAQTTLLQARILRDSQGNITGLGTPETPSGFLATRSMEMFARGVECQNASDIELLFKMKQFVQQRFV